jgi:hypothetical protein
MDKTPFNIYDFFAYLSSGSVLLITADYACSLGQMNREKFPPVLMVAVIIFTYTTGQIVAHLSSFLYEHNIVGRVLKSPSVLLMAENPQGANRLKEKTLPGFLAWLWTAVFPGYHQPLAPSVQKRIRELAAARHCSMSGEDLFEDAFALVTSTPANQPRLELFLNQYGFARNMSFAFVASGVWLFIAHQSRSGAVDVRWAFAALAVGIALFYRYLKFFRQYSFELFLRYSELPLPKEEHAPVHKKKPAQDARPLHKPSPR